MDLLHQLSSFFPTGPSPSMNWTGLPPTPIDGSHVVDAGWNVLEFAWWTPEWMHHLLPILPADFPKWTDLWVSLPIAVLITFVRFFVCDPIASRIVVSRLGLARTSLRDRMRAQKKMTTKGEGADGDYIPQWVMTEMDGFAQDMILLKKRLKKKKRSEIEIRVEKQKKWRAFTAALIERSASGKLEGGRLTQAQLNGWWGVIKRDSARSLEIQKFNEAFWRAGFYSFIWAYGIWVGLRESWLLDMRAIWGGWPLFQPVSLQVRWYYYLSLGHYVHLFVTQFFEPKRKDWWEMFIHHIVTMLLLFFSYLVSFTRIGVIVLLCHDGSDIFLELAKLFNYLRFTRLCDATFSVFALAFFLGRLVLYPWRVVYVAIALGSEQVGVWRAFYIFVTLLLVLQVLHIFWFATIAKMVYAFVVVGNVEKDVREESESDAEEVTGSAAGADSASSMLDSPQPLGGDKERMLDAAGDPILAVESVADTDGPVQRASRRARSSQKDLAVPSARVTRSRSRGKDL